VAMGLFAAALMFGHIALRPGMNAGPPREQVRRRGRKHRRSGRPRS